MSNKSNTADKVKSQVPQVVLSVALGLLHTLFPLVFRALQIHETLPQRDDLLGIPPWVVESAYVFSLFSSVTMASFFVYTILRGYRKMRSVALLHTSLWMRINPMGPVSKETSQHDAAVAEGGRIELRKLDPLYDNLPVTRWDGAHTKRPIPWVGNSHHIWVPPLPSRPQKARDLASEGEGEDEDDHPLSKLQGLHSLLTHQALYTEYRLASADFTASTATAFVFLLVLALSSLSYYLTLYDSPSMQNWPWLSLVDCIVLGTLLMAISLAGMRLEDERHRIENLLKHYQFMLGRAIEDLGHDDSDASRYIAVLHRRRNMAALINAVIQSSFRTPRLCRLVPLSRAAFLTAAVGVSARILAIGSTALR